MPVINVMSTREERILFASTITSPVYSNVCLERSKALAALLLGHTRLIVLGDSHSTIRTGL